MQNGLNYFEKRVKFAFWVEFKYYDNRQIMLDKAYIFYSYNLYNHLRFIIFFRKLEKLYPF